MSRWLVVLAVCAVLSSTSVVLAQFRAQQSSSPTSEYLRDHEQQQLSLNAVRGLLDPSRMKMSHSVSFGYASLGGTGVSRGLYMNRIDYQLAKPLMLTTHLGYQFQPSGPAEWNPATTGQDFVGAADLTWQPTSNALFRLSVAKGMAPSNMYGYSPYGSWGYGYQPWMFPGRP
ncbi:MAG: hypothetical protein H6508_04160 [Calditrichaeota bacterium]|nr:hypothetical protein [Calditrichota bacterium]MCB9366362.1 hypothetical protein [Calditrichota bacterium]